MEIKCVPKRVNGRDKKYTSYCQRLLGFSFGMTLVFLFMNPFQIFAAADKAQKSEEKSYVSLKPSTRYGDPPQITIGKPLIDKKTKLGRIPIKVEIQGVWRSEKKLNKTYYDLLEIPNGGYTTEVGAPMISTISLEIEIPADAKFKDLLEKATLIRKFENVTLAPAQEPPPVVGLTARDKDFIQKKQEFIINRETYKQTSPYPGRYSEIIADNFLGHRHIIIVKLFPIQFIPAKKMAKIYSLELDILFSNK